MNRSSLKSAITMLAVSFCGTFVFTTALAEADPFLPMVFFPADNTPLTIAGGGKRATANIPTIDTPPKIDGVIDEKEWAVAFKIDDFKILRGMALQKAQALMGGGDPLPMLEKCIVPTQPTKAWIMVDKSNLYVGMRCFEERMRDLEPAIVKGRDAPLFGGDCVELFVNSMTDDAEYYHIITNAGGHLYDEKGRESVESGMIRQKSDESWDSKAQVKAVCFDDRWEVEIAVPLESLGVTFGSVNRLVMNLTRGEYLRKEYSTWSPCERSFHERHNFAKATIGSGKVDSIDIVELKMTPPGYGKNVLLCKVFNSGKTDLPATLTVNVKFLSDGKSLQADKVDFTCAAAAEKIVEVPFSVAAAGDCLIKAELVGNAVKAVVDSLGARISIPETLIGSLDSQLYPPDASVALANFEVNVSPQSLGSCVVEVSLSQIGGGFESRKQVDAISGKKMQIPIRLDKLPASAQFEINTRLLGSYGKNGISAIKTRFSKEPGAFD